MSATGDNLGQARRLLCVAPACEGQPHPAVLAALDAGAELETVEDVYRATARLRSQRWVAVLVAVDRLDPCEMEFFELLSRYHRDLPVYVFSASASSVGIDAALRCGARGVIRSDTAVDLLSPLLAQACGPDAFEEEALGAPADGQPSIDAALERRLAALAALDNDNGAQPKEECEDEIDRASVVAEPQREAPRRKSRPGGRKGGARVPWRAYEDRPQRRPPSRPSQSPPATPAQPAQPADEAEPPLLTSEELAALIGDDAAPDSSAPQPRRNNQ